MSTKVPTLTALAALPLLSLLSLLGPPAAAAPESPAEQADEKKKEEAKPPVIRKSEDIVVQAVRAEADTPVTKTDIPRAELALKNAGQEMPYLLREVPSVTFYSDTGIATGYSYVSLRGVGPTRINFTLDGAPLNEPEDGTLYFVDFGDFGSSVESIQVQRGVGTSSSGVASFVGSVNFASLDLTEKLETTARFSLGSFGTKRATAGVQSGRFGDGWKAYVRGSYQATDGFRDNSAINQRSLFAGVSHESESGYFKLFGFVGRERTQEAFYAADAETLETDIRFNPMDPAEKDSFGQNFVEAQYTAFLGPKTSLGAQLYVNNASGWYTLWADPEKATLWQYGLSWTNVGGALTFKTSTGPVGLTVGLHGSGFESTHSRDVVDGGHDYDNHGYKNDLSGFVKATWDSGPWHVYGDAQLRWARFRYEGSLDLGSVSWTFLNPKLGVRRDLGRDVTAYASVGTTGREPARGDMLLGEDNATVYHDLAAVKPEKVLAFELGAQVRRGRFSAQVNLYDMEFHDEIALTGEQSEVGLALRKNVDRSSRTGLEWDLGWQALDQLRLRFTGSWSRNRIKSWTQFYDVYDTQGEWIGTTQRTFQDVQPLLTPPFIGNLSVEWSPVKSVTLGAAGRWVDRAYLDNTNAEGITTPSWTKVDLSASVDLSSVIPTGRPRLRLLVDNVFDARHLYPNGYSYLYATRDPLGNDTFAGSRYYYPLATRNATLVLDLGF